MPAGLPTGAPTHLRTEVECKAVSGGQVGPTKLWTSLGYWVTRAAAFEPRTAQRLRFNLSS